MLNGEIVPFVHCQDCENYHSEQTLPYVEGQEDIPIFMCKIIQLNEDGEREDDEEGLRTAETTWADGKGNCQLFCMITSRDGFDR